MQVCIRCMEPLQDGICAVHGEQFAFLTVDRPLDSQEEQRLRSEIGAKKAANAALLATSHQKKCKTCKELFVPTDPRHNYCRKCGVPYFIRNSSQSR